jgi:hypothetical protein
MLCPERVSQICQTIDINCRYNNQKSDTNGDKCHTPLLLKLKRALSWKDTNCVSLYLLFSSLLYRYFIHIRVIYTVYTVFPYFCFLYKLYVQWLEITKIKGFLIQYFFLLLKWYSLLKVPNNKIRYTLCSLLICSKNKIRIFLFILLLSDHYSNRLYFSYIESLILFRHEFKSLSFIILFIKNFFKVNKSRSFSHNVKRFSYVLHCILCYYFSFYFNSQSFFIVLYSHLMAKSKKCCNQMFFPQIEKFFSLQKS